MAYKSIRDILLRPVAEDPQPFDFIWFAFVAVRIARLVMRMWAVIRPPPKKKR